MPINLVSNRAEFSGQSDENSDSLNEYNSIATSETDDSDMVFFPPVHPTTRAEGGREASPVLHEPVELV